jgi:hypothetical protein
VLCCFTTKGNKWWCNTSSKCQNNVLRQLLVM